MIPAMCVPGSPGLGFQGLGFRVFLRPRPTSPISQGNKRLNFQITTKSKEPKQFKGWVLENYVEGEPNLEA